ncbi:polysaccharide biosynthesis protein [Cellvibrio polysaccharolyticus]|uniref:Polysaccharide biosynthesis protein n=1 Tax=Cellvibrio polysaccharolyticus TaxID=2082724 RepID=A0A928V4L4_9GAMM|nr:nucleoside-diphosphate sugar epimerase/dehydratase [Cellvibrio polysaccharolyticus]MBE8718673.1 polysaccharide biosynthesis protein [Cellvibrio polysaccharolyticus]
MLKALLEAPRSTKRVISLCYDTVAITLAYYAATCMRLGNFSIPFTERELTALSITIVVSLFIFIRMGMYRAILRYMTLPTLLTIAICVCLSGLVLALAGFFTHSRIPRSVPFIYITTAILLIGAPRLLMRNIILLLNQPGLLGKEMILIYGAGYTGHQLALALPPNQYHIAGFIDDNPALHGTVLANKKVYSPEMVVSLKAQGITKVLLALGDAPKSRRAQVIKRLESLLISVQTVPAIDDLISGKASIDHIRDIEIEDLLGRDPVQPNLDLLHAGITRKVVMVTGAGGSIGSELCRQILQQLPSTLVLFELNEYSLYQIEQELSLEIALHDLPVQLVSLLGSVQKEHRLETIMRTYGVQTIYHAAAYKHVPLVEQNIVEGVRNNVFGTWYCAEAAIRAKVESFVLISTDKAVRSTNVMGASKRMAELVLQGLSQRQNTTRFTMVRFGNVLGSSGSVVPLFRQQIKNGGPVTVTHPEITRYFMTIPEAAELVIQAGSMGQGGDVFVLDMGEPVKIIDLATRMIHLSGLEVRDDANPEGDIEIECTGLRPGEKLYEELLIGDNVTGTDHVRIMRAEEHHLTWPETRQILDELDKACHHWRCDEVKDLLIQAPTEFHSTEPLCDSVWLRKQHAMKKVVSIVQ